MMVLSPTISPSCLVKTKYSIPPAHLPATTDSESLHMSLGIFNMCPGESLNRGRFVSDLRQRRLLRHLLTKLLLLV